jgi:hypothetical protein
MIEEIDLQQCEHCDKQFPVETMTTMDDGWFCEDCMSEWATAFSACEHQWEPYTDGAGDEGRICTRCSGFVPLDWEI